MSIQFAASPAGTKNLLLGGGPNLLARGILTADDVHVDGLYWMRPWDMTQFGTPGAAAMAASGFRYAWFFSSDHYDIHGWKNGGGIHLGWSNDPGIPPRHSVMVIDGGFTIGAHSYAQLETPWLVYDPVEDDIRLYGHAVNMSANKQDTVVFTGTTLYSWTLIGISHSASVGGHAGYQLVYRDAADFWWSQGLVGTSNSANGYWTSTDGFVFTLDRNLGNGVTGDGVYVAGSGAMALYSIASQRYMLGFTDNGQRRAAVVPIGSECEIPATVDDIITLSTGFGSISNGYPGPKYLQGIDVAIEDGIAHIYPKRGFFGDNGLVGGAAYGAGGGLDDQIMDYYRYIIDDTVARTSAPAGVRASVNGGLVTLSWYDVLPQRTYRGYVSVSADMSGKTSIGDVEGTELTHTPGSDGTRYYEIMTLNAGVEEKSRIVSPYVSVQSPLVNEHAARVLASGGDIGTIDLDHVAWAEDVLDEIGAKQHLAFWVRPEFGHIKDGSNVLSRMFCLGTTLKPRGQDLTFATSNSIYSATAWNGLPGWSSSTGAGQGYFGGTRINTIRRASGITMISSVQKSHTGAVFLFGWGEFGSTNNLGLLSGSPASASLNCGGTADTHGTTLANNDDHIVGAVLSPTTCKVFVEGIGGTGFNANAASAAAIVGNKGNGEFDGFFWATGSASAKFRPNPSTRFYSNSSQYATRDKLMFTAPLNDTQMATLNTRLRAGP